MARARGVAAGEEPAATQTQDQPDEPEAPVEAPRGALDVEAWVADVWEHVHNGGPVPARRYLEH